MQDAANIASQAFGQNAHIDIPLIGGTLDSALGGLTQDIKTPFQTDQLDINAAWTTIQQQLANAGFTVQYPLSSTFTGSQDTNGDLLRVKWTSPPNWNTTPVVCVASGQTGFDYFNQITSGLLTGVFSASAPTISFQVTLGVDVQTISGVQQLSFYVDQSSGLTIGGFTASGSFGGNVGLGSLGNVDVSATASLSVTSATLSFVPGASGPEPDGKLRFADFQPNNIKNSIAGNVQGSVQLNPVTITADFLNLGDISWSANFSGTFNNTVWTQGTVNLNPPSVQTVLSDLAGGFFNLGGGFFSSSGGFPILGPLSNALNQQLPLIDESIAQLTGLDGDLPNLPTPGDLGLGSILSSLESIPGLQINDGDTSMDINDPNGLPAMVNKLINGQPTDIISWSASDDIQLADFSETIPILGIGIPDIASVELDATFGFSAELTYDVGLGIDSNGFYFKAGTPDDPTVSLEFEADAGIEGRLEVFGFSLADAGGDIGFEPKLYVNLTAPSYSANPGRVYMSDLATFGSNPFNDFLDALGGGIQGDLTGNLYAGINLLFFSISWNWGIEIPVFNYSLNPAWPPQASAGGGRPSNG